MKRKSIYLLTGVIISLGFIGCGKSTQTPTPINSQNNTVSESNALTTNIVATPIPTQRSSKFTTPVETDYVIGDIDFTYYFTSDKEWYTIVNESANEDLMLIAKTFSDIYVLKDGDSFEMERKEEKLIGYKFFVYSSKEAISIAVPDKWKDIVEINSIDNDYGNINFYFTIKKDVSVSNRKLQILINYEDGTQDTFTFTLNKPYEYTCTIGQ